MTCLLAHNSASFSVVNPLPNTRKIHKRSGLPTLAPCANDIDVPEDEEEEEPDCMDLPCIVLAIAPFVPLLAASLLWVVTAVLLPLLKHWYHIGTSSKSKATRDNKNRLICKYNG